MQVGGWGCGCRWRAGVSWRPTCTFMLPCWLLAWGAWPVLPPIRLAWPWIPTRPSLWPAVLAAHSYLRVVVMDRAAYHTPTHPQTLRVPATLTLLCYAVLATNPDRLVVVVAHAAHPLA